MDFNRLRSHPEYNTRAVVLRTGVPADTFRAWERRYGWPRPSRTGGNQRLYSERDMAVISWLREQTRNGLSISRAVDHLARSLDAPDGQRPQSSEPGGDSALDGPHQYPALKYRLVESLLAYDADGAARTLEEAAAFLSMEQICLGLLQPTLADIGERWSSGEIPISVEHYASGFILRRLGTLFNASRPDTGDPTVLAACAEGELHEVGLLVTSLLLSHRGFRVVHLGANVPADDLRQAIRRIAPDAVLLAASTEPVARRLAAEVADLARWFAESPGAAPKPLICVGGLAFVAEPSLREDLAAHYLGDNSLTALHELSRLIRERAA